MLWFWILCYLFESGCLLEQCKIYETFQVTTKIHLHDGDYALLAIYSNQSGAHNFLWSDRKRRFEYFKIAKLVQSNQLNSSPVTRIQSFETEGDKQAISFFREICKVRAGHLLPSTKDVLSHRNGFNSSDGLTCRLQLDRCKGCQGVTGRTILILSILVL